MDCADDMLTSVVVNDRVGKVAVELAVGGVVVAAKQAHFGRDGLADEAVKSDGLYVLDDARDDVAFTGDSVATPVIPRAGSRPRFTAVWARAKRSKPSASYKQAARSPPPN